jgi:cyclopropane fatty-acyl-phospholipid synthase-like methyltransferase
MSQNNETYWSDRWESVVARSPLRRRRAEDPAGLKRWNQRAAGFAKNSKTDSANARRKTTLAMLSKEGALFSGARVLDIGAGPGAWALALAEAGAIVTALEPADAMADLLESHIASAGTANITVVRNTWQAVDLDTMGWRGAFDLLSLS